MSRRRTLEPLGRIFEADAKLAAWNDRRRQEAALLAALRRQLPRTVAEQVAIAGVEGSTLIVAVASGALASVLRQKTPELATGLKREGWQFSRIQVRTQPRSMPMSWEKKLSRQWDSQSRVPMAALCSRLPEGPLKAALARFLRSR